MRRWLRFAFPIVVVSACVAIGVSAYLLAGRAWDGVVGYSTPYAEGLPPTDAPDEPLADRVVLVILDGLRLDASRQMATLETLRERGTDLVVKADQPSLSYPDWSAILTGGTQDVHGVVTNWHEGACEAETVLDTASRTGAPFVVVGPSDLATLYPAVSEAEATYFRAWDSKYMATEYVDAAIRLTRREDPRLVLLHIPDIDEAGHESGGDSDEYRDVVARVDGDIRRLVEDLQDESTVFVFVSDHGHIDSGGHGGWEAEVIDTPVVIAGDGVAMTEGSASQADLASTVALFAGLPTPRYSTGAPLTSAVVSASASALDEIGEQRALMAEHYASIAYPYEDVSGDPDEVMELAAEKRLRADRSDRIGAGLAILAAGLTVFVSIGAVSRQALGATLAGALTGTGVYNVLFFLVHGHRWSLSAFNEEELVQAWMNVRMAEAVVAGLIAAAVAGFVYPYLRRRPFGPEGRYLPGWLTLGPAAILVQQAILAIQVAWFVWWWGVEPVWSLPDLMWGFKFDLDLVQMTALGAAAVLAPLVTYAIGRYHPRVASKAVDGGLSAVEPPPVDAAAIIETTTEE